MLSIIRRQWDLTLTQRHSLQSTSRQPTDCRHEKMHWCIISLFRVRSASYQAIEILFFFTECDISCCLIAEAEYMYRLRKDIIPLVLQPGYSPDGWLGILVGTRLYFDLSTPSIFDSEVSRLVTEIGNRGRLTGPFHRCLSTASAATPPPRSVSESPGLENSVPGANSTLLLYEFSRPQCDN